MKNCSLGIKEGFEALVSLKDDQSWYNDLSVIFKTCTPVNSSLDVIDLYGHFGNAFTYMAMTDYPYASNFLQPMPASPVNVSCEAY